MDSLFCFAEYVGCFCASVQLREDFSLCNRSALSCFLKRNLSHEAIGSSVIGALSHDKWTI